MKNKAMKSVVAVAVVVGLFMLGACGGGGSEGEGGGSTTATTGGKYAGTYSGTWVATAGGTDTGTFTMTVDSNGVISGSERNNADGTTATGSGTVDATGKTQALFGTTSNGSNFSGTVDANGQVSGTWSQPSTGSSGTFIGQRQ